MPVNPSRVVLVAAAMGILLCSAPSHAWPREAYRNMVYDTLRLLPPRLTRVLIHRADEIFEGVSSLPSDTASSIAAAGQNGTVSTELVRDVELRVMGVADMVSDHRSFDEVARELGHLLRIAADLSDPAMMGSGRPELRRVVREYYRFVELNLSTLPLVYDKGLPSTLSGATVRGLLERAASDASSSVPALESAFWSGGQVVPATAFDYRSVPYAETSLGYSRAVTAAAYLWLSAWSKANGDFTGYRFADPKTKP